MGLRDGSPSTPAPGPASRTISRRVEEAEDPESVVLPLGGHRQLLHGGARLGAATSDINAHHPTAGGQLCPAPPTLPRPPHSREGTAGSAGSSSDGPRRPHTSPQTRAGSPALCTGGEGVSLSTPSPQPPPTTAGCRAHLLPPGGCLMCEVQWGRPSRSPRKQRVQVLVVGLQERKGTRVRAGGHVS